MKNYIHNRKLIRMVSLYVIVGVTSICMIIPLLYMFSTSFREHGYTIEFSGSIIPDNPTIINFTRAWSLYNFKQYFINSLIVSIISLFFEVLIASMMAYAFARLEFPAKEFIFYLVILVLMIPNLANIIPQFFIAKALGLRDSLLGLSLFYVANMLPLNTFLLRGFFESLPKELEDAVLIDGGSYFTIFSKIIIPLSTPAIATIAIFSLLSFWDELILALTLIDNVNLRTLPVAIAAVHGQYGTDWGLVFAASLIAVIPVILMFVFMQKYFIGGLTSGAFKG